MKKLSNILISALCLHFSSLAQISPHQQLTIIADPATGRFLGANAWNTYQPNPSLVTCAGCPPEHRWKLDSTYRRSGKYSYRYEVRKGDYSGVTSKTERAENSGNNDASGHKFGDSTFNIPIYESFSLLLDTSWVPPNETVSTAEEHGVVYQKHKGDGTTLDGKQTSPFFAIQATDRFYATTSVGDGKQGAKLLTRKTFEFGANGALVKGKWVDFMIRYVYSQTSTGSIRLYMRLQGQTTFRKVMDYTGPTVQWNSDSLLADGTPKPVWSDNHIGYYRGGQDTIKTNIVYFGKYTRSLDSATAVNNLGGVIPNTSCGGVKRTLVRNADGTLNADGNSLIYSPADSLFIPAGTYTDINISNIHGTSGCPVVITNGGNVTANNIKILSSQYKKLTGLYPITTANLTVEGRSSDVEAEKITATKIRVAQDINCDTTLDAPNWILNNISVHDVATDSVFFGTDYPNGKAIVCGTSKNYKPLRITNAKAYNITGKYVQLSGGDAEIYNNSLTGDIKIDSSSKANVHDNITTGRIYNYGSGFNPIINNSVKSITTNNVVTITGDSAQYDIEGNTTDSVTLNKTGTNNYSLLNFICGNKKSDGTYSKVTVAAGITYGSCFVDTFPPAFVSASPNGTFNNPNNTSVTITFNEPIRNLTSENFTITGTIASGQFNKYIAADGKTAVADGVIYNYDSVYMVRLTGVTDTAGNVISPVNFSFAIASAPPPPDTQAPTVSLADPPDNATGVSIYVNPAITMSEKVNPSTVTGTNIKLLNSSLQTVASTDSLDEIDGRTIYVIPNALLGYSKVYYVRLIAGGVKDLANNAIASQYQSQFTTEAQPLPPAPKAIATASTQTIIYPETGKPNSISLDGTQSSGTGITYRWSQKGALVTFSNQSGSTTLMTLDTSQSLTVRLMITDAYGRKDSAFIPITVYKSPLIIPVVTIAGAENIEFIQAPADSVTLDGSASHDYYNLPTNYKWTCNDSTVTIDNDTAKVTKARYLKVNKQTDFTLKGTNSQSFSAEAVKSVFIKPQEQPGICSCP